MKLKLGLITGFAIGYYLGTAAGKERHEQLKQLIAKVSRSAPVSSATDQAKSVADTQFHKAKDKVNDKMHRNQLGETVEFMPS